MAARDIRKFGDAARASADKGESDEDVTIAILGREVVIESPGSGQLAYLTMMATGDMSDMQLVGSLCNFMANLLHEEDRSYFESTLLRRNNGFEAEDVIEIAQYLLECWSSDPTGSSTDSSPQPRRSGRSSTGASRRATQTPSGSPSDAS